MFNRLGSFVSRFWWLVIATWVAGAAVVVMITPKWDDITHDGDLAYLPEAMPSVQGERLLEAAFPDSRARSQIVLVLAKDDQALGADDFRVADELARRFHNYRAAAGLVKCRRMESEAQEALSSGDQEQAQELQRWAKKEQDAALASWDEAILLDEQFAEAYHNRAILHDKIGKKESAKEDRELAWALNPELASKPDRLVPEGASDLPLIDVWTRHTQVVGKKLRSKDKMAQLVVLQLSNEFMATDNIRVLELVENEVNDVRMSMDTPSGLQIGLSGSATVGGDMLRSAAESISNTELYTVILVVVILVLVYRSPLLVAVPLTTIIVSLVVSTGLVAALTQLHLVDGMQWWNFKVFTTTKIFVVVILFGAGTDF